MVCLTETELTAALFVAAALGRPAGRAVLTTMGKARERARLSESDDTRNDTPDPRKK